MLDRSKEQDKLFDSAATVVSKVFQCFKYTDVACLRVVLLFIFALYCIFVYIDGY